MLLFVTTASNAEIHYVDELIFSQFSDTDKTSGDLQLQSVCTNGKKTEERSVYVIQAKSGHMAEARVWRSCGSSGCSSHIDIKDGGVDVGSAFKFCAKNGLFE